MPLPEPVEESLCDAVGVTDEVEVPLSVLLPLPLSVGVPVADRLPLSELDCVAEGVGVDDCDALPVHVADAERVALAVELALRVALDECVTDAESEGLCVRVGVALVETVRLSLPLALPL